MYLSKALGKGSRAPIMEGMTGPFGSRMHAGGFEEAFRQLGVLSIVARQAGNRLTEMNTTMATLKAHSDLKAIYAAKWFSSSSCAIRRSTL